MDRNRVLDRPATTATARAGLNAYLDATDPYAEIRILLFNQGTQSSAWRRAQDWQRTAARAREIGVLTGVDATAYPRDFASLVRSHRELSRIRTRCPMPLPLDAAAVALTAPDEIAWQPV